MRATNLKIGGYETGGDGSEDTKEHRWEEQLSFGGNCGFVMRLVRPFILDTRWARVISLKCFFDDRFENKRKLRTSIRLESFSKTGSSESFIFW
jgi:hypothetical protein